MVEIASSTGRAFGIGNGSAIQSRTRQGRGAEVVDWASFSDDLFRNPIFWPTSMICR